MNKNIFTCSEKNIPKHFAWVDRPWTPPRVDRDFPGQSMEPASGIEPLTYGLRNRSGLEEDRTSSPLPDKETNDLEKNSD